MTLKSTLGLTAVVLMSAAGMVNGATITAAQSGRWDVGSTWVGGVAPQDGDVALIDAAYTVTVDVNNAEADSVTLNHASAKVVVEDGYSLTLDSSSTWTNGQFELNGGTLIIDSGGVFTVPSGKTFVMKGTSPVLDIRQADGFRLSASDSKLQIKSDATIQGASSGSLRGDASAALIEIDVTAGNVTLTLASSAIMHKGFTIQKGGTDNGNANFVNAGVVQADSSLTISLGDELNSITDSYGAGSRCDVHWRAESGPSILSFEIPATSLVTSFFVDGTFNCNGNTVTTTGNKSGANPPACVGVGSPC